MTRWLVILVVVLAAGFAALVLWPRDQATSGSARQPAAGGAGQAASGTVASGPASFTVLVDGQEVRADVATTGIRMADTPVSSWNASMISHRRAIGSSQVLVFVDGSEAMLDSFTLERLPSDVAYRAGYDRD